MKVFDRENKQRSLEPFHFVKVLMGLVIDYGTVVKLTKAAPTKSRYTGSSPVSASSIKRFNIAFDVPSVVWVGVRNLPLYLRVA